MAKDCIWKGYTFSLPLWKVPPSRAAFSRWCKQSMYAPSAYNPAYYHDDNDDDEGRKHTTSASKYQPIKIRMRVSSVKAYDVETDDSDEELGAMIYRSSHTAKKFREEAKRKKESFMSTSSESPTPSKTKLKRKKSQSSATTKRTRRKCSIDECTSYPRKGGVCTRHGAKRKICSHDGCTTNAYCGGVCWPHGAKVASSATTTKRTPRAPLMNAPILLLKEEFVRDMVQRKR